jgi:hypothetical protein
MGEVVDVFNILIDLNILQIGDIVRLSRCNAELLFCVRSHVSLWKKISMWTHTSPQYTSCTRYLKLYHCCRECGESKTNALRSVLGNTVYVCSHCSTCLSNYSFIVSRNEINRAFKTKKMTNKVIWNDTSIFKGLHVAKRGRSNQFFYWGYEWKTPLRGFWLKRIGC